MKLLRLIVWILVLVLLTSSCLVFVSPDKETELTIDVPAVTLSSTYSLNGEPFPISLYSRGFFSLRNPESGDTAALGDSRDQHHNTVIIQGVYDVVYAHTIGSDLPQNKGDAVMTAVAIQSDQALNVDVATVEVSPHFTLNGKPFSTSVYNSAEFYLQSIAGGERVYLGKSSTENASINILPGTYNVIYSHFNGDQVPLNKDAVVKAAVTIDADQILEVDVAAVSLKTTYSVNGEPFPETQYSKALFSLRDVESGDTIELGYSNAQYHNTMLISGIYDVVYGHVIGSDIPQNKEAIVISEVDISSRRALPIDIPAITLRSTYSLNGEPFPESQYSRAFFSLRSPGSGDTAALGDSKDQFHNTVIIPGVYDVIYDHIIDSALPQNKGDAVMTAVAIQSDQVLNVDVASIEISPHFTLNGKPFPTIVYDSAEFYLQSISGGERVYLGKSYKENAPIEILPGTYDVIYSHCYGGEVPLNKNAIVKSAVTIDTDQVLEVDVAAVTLKTSYSVNGEPFPETLYSRALFSLRDTVTGDTTALGYSKDQYHITMMVSGVYDVVYAHTIGSDIPQNKEAIVMSDVDISAS